MSRFRTKLEDVEIIRKFEKFNPNHDELGQFATSDSSGDYQMSHRPAMGGQGDAEGAPLHDLTSNGTYPSNAYASDGARMYSTGYKEMDKKVHDLITRVKGNPDAIVKIYRAVPKGVTQIKIGSGDWVTPIKDYAVQHGESNLNGEFNILTADVRAGDIYTSGDSWLEWGYNPTSVQKHGTHDQSTHGSWATRVSTGTVSDIQRFTREWGGLSISMVDGHMPDKGFMVAKPPEFGAIVDEADFFDPIKGPKILADYMKKNRADLGRGGKDYLGTWLNGGKIYLDVSQNMMNREEAIQIGADRRQKAIWDVVNQLEIDTGGTGEVEKRNQDSSTSRYIGDDGQRNRRLRTGDLGQVNKVKVIHFSPGLIPIIKHSGGDAHGGTDDQSSHGSWATGGYSAEQQAGMAEMEGQGPSIDDLDNLYNAILSNASGPSLDEMKAIVENDQGLYEQATEDIDFRVEERLAALQAEFPLHEYSEQEKSTIYENVQSDMIDEFVNNESDTIHQLYEDQNGGSARAQMNNMEGYMNEVYSYEHTGKNINGDDVTLYSKVHEIGFAHDRDGIEITGVVKSTNGDIAGEFQRTMYKENGVWMVEHDIFQMSDEYKGTGFGTKFIQQQEDWYTARGFGAIVVGTAWDGARHWARAGYDWHPDHVEDNISRIANESQYNTDFGAGSENRKEFNSLMSRAFEGYNPDANWSSQKINGTVKMKPMTNDDFPLPNDFATIGIANKTRDSEGVSQWGGKSLMDGLNLKYQKVLTAEGRSVIEGPVDRDGDGLVYDGTAREKPAPTVNSTP